MKFKYNFRSQITYNQSINN